MSSQNYKNFLDSSPNRYSKKPTITLANNSEISNNDYYNYDTYTLNSCKLLLTPNKNKLNGLNLKKFDIINNNSFNSSTKSKINNTSLNSSNNPISNYISCSTLQSPCNVSYTIPKEQRFRNIYHSGYCDSLYSLPELSKNTSITIGKSRRKDFIAKDKIIIPSSQQYSFNSLFEENLIKKRGYSISNKIFYKVKYSKLFFIRLMNLKIPQVLQILKKI